MTFWPPAPDHAMDVPRRLRPAARRRAGTFLVESKASWNGMHRRLALLAARGIEPPQPFEQAGTVRPDDVIDACALAWTGTRIAAGGAPRLGDTDSMTRDQAIYV